MSFSLNTHPSGYELSSVDLLFSAVSFSGKVYADRHLELSNRQERIGRLGHRFIAVLESILVVGALVAIIERVIVYALAKFSKADKQSSDKKIDAERVSQQGINQNEQINSANNKPEIPLVIQALLLVRGFCHSDGIKGRIQE
jgi:hypothetical protein